MRCCGLTSGGSKALLTARYKRGPEERHERHGVQLNDMTSGLAAVKALLAQIGGEIADLEDRLTVVSEALAAVSVSTPTPPRQPDR
ncbi:hypothetical protein GCM10012280_22790 [Wenjunlia tyrosinilytica]|uniref:Uncharacterized protein n=1 Tax=Wenjunlia tyrosinilytica TaxID=1544741 RepID=A0A917ZN49_9ACTN|nr:hypothetical protein GCM10012280_22790 [Wenjunlia tyrosinilytica]